MNSCGQVQATWSLTVSAQRLLLYSIHRLSVSGGFCSTCALVVLTACVSTLHIYQQDTERQRSSGHDLIWTMYGKGLTWSKIAHGMANVQQAFGASTSPEIRPSHGQQDSIK